MAQITLNSSGVASNGSLALQSNGTTTAVTVDASQNVGIGTSSPSVKLDIVGANNGSQLRFGNGRLYTYSTSSSGGYDNSLLTLDSNSSVTQYAWSVGGSEKVRIDTSGNLLVGTTSAVARAVISRADNDVVFRAVNGLSSGTTVDLFQVISAQAAGSGFNLLRLFTSNGGAAQFAVRADGVVFAQNTTIQSISDARVKENVRDADNGLETVLGLRPVRFDFKEGFGNNRKNQLGFIAQEVETVFPDAVDAAGDKDEHGEHYKSVGPGAMIPVLVKAIQEQQAIITQLQADVAALKGTA